MRCRPGWLHTFAGRLLLLAVVAGLCLPAVTMLALGLVFSPVLLLSLLTGQWSNALGLLLLLGGAWGMLALLQLTWQVGWPRPGQRVRRWGLLAGVLANGLLLSGWPADLGQAWFQGGALLALLLLCWLRHANPVPCTDAAAGAMAPVARGQG